MDRRTLLSSSVLLSTVGLAACCGVTAKIIVTRKRPDGSMETVEVAGSGQACGTPGTPKAPTTAAHKAYRTAVAATNSQVRFENPAIALSLTNSYGNVFSSQLFQLYTSGQNQLSLLNPHAASQYLTQNWNATSVIQSTMSGIIWTVNFGASALAGETFADNLSVGGFAASHFEALGRPNSTTSIQ